ncbi:MAG: hypothetical protein IPH08_03385 [Rhodocyclaceae bacterium]|nr:hypothetical protein [Rhodocyclaceae bacterium]
MNARHAALLTALALTIAACAGGSNPGQSGSATVAAMPDTATMTVQERVKAGRALWEEKCRTVAGEKIYRTVENVEGILLMKLRRAGPSEELSDPNWPGAAFATERTDGAYIETFLGYEHSSDPRGLPVSKERRGYVTAEFNPRDASNLPGYRWVDVVDEQDGKRWRYTSFRKVVGQKDETAFNVQLELTKNPNYDLNIYRWTLDKKPALDPAPRYGVTFEDHVIPEERDLGVASSTVKVIDLQTNEVMGEYTPYVVSGALSKYNPTLWLTAYGCKFKGDAGATTRKFVDQILIPKKLEN